jgi:hypothetical protein
MGAKELQGLIGEAKELEGLSGEAETISVAEEDSGK